MAFTTFDLSAAEFPDSFAPGTYTDGKLVPTLPSNGLLFWLPGMTRDLALWYTIAVDFEVTGDFPYTARPVGNAFQWRNDGDYGSSSGSTLATADTGRKEVQSLVFQVGPGGDPDEERVAFFMFGNTPPVTGVRWEPMSAVVATGGDFTTAQAAPFGQVYSADWSLLTSVGSENTTLGTPSITSAAWFTVTMTAAGMLQTTGVPGASIYSGTSLGGLTLISDTATAAPVDLSAGTYYVRVWNDSSPTFTSFPSFVGYASETVFGPWITPSPVDIPIELDSDGGTDSGATVDTYVTQQRVDAGTAPGGVGLWWEVVQTSGTSAAPPFDTNQVGVAVARAESGGTALDNTTPFGGTAEWRIENSHFDDSPGGTLGSRTYRAAGRRTAWFFSLKLPLDPVPDDLATGWQNEDGSNDTTPIGVASTGDFDATFQHTDTTDDGIGWTVGSWVSHFATVEGAALNVGGNVDYDQVTHPGAVDLFTFPADSDNLTENKTTTITLPGDDLYGFVQWTTPPDAGDNRTGNLGTFMSDGTITVTYILPDYRSRFEGIEVLMPLVGQILTPAPLRMYPRSDGLGAGSARRVYPPPQTVQASNRRGPAAII